MATHAKPSEATRRVSVGSVPLGGGAPVVVQSMLNAPATDVAANLVQIDALAQAGCEIVRMAIPHRSSLDVFQAVCERSPLPVVADIHFDARIAVEAAKRGAAKLRINPGNIGGLAKTDAVLDAAGEAGIPIRIGVNAGSLDNELAARDDLSQSEKLARSAADYVRYCEGRGFHDLVVSAKAHDAMTTVRTYRLLSKELPHVPLHIGVTEAGTTFQGAIKSACGLGILLEEGIGDTLRISLTDDPVQEIRACWTLLSALDLRRRAPELISCPTCGRCQVDLIGLAREVEGRIANLDKPLKVAVMGCVVNGPGEAADADIGVACGVGSGVVFSKGNVVRKVEESAIVDALMEEIGSYDEREYHAHEPAVRAHAQGGSRRRGDRQPQAAFARGLHPQTASGVYTFLPLGKRVLAKVENIVREEMDGIGAQEIMMPRCSPASCGTRAAAGTTTAPSSCASSTVTTASSASGPPTRSSSPPSCATSCAPTRSCRCRCTRSR